MRTESRPHVGLGIDHGTPRRLNWDAHDWVRKRLTELWSQGYRRVVIERDGDELQLVERQGYFDSLAEHARDLGFEIRRESRTGHRITIRERRRGAPKGMADHRKYARIMDAMRSNRMKSMAFREPGSVIVAGAAHVGHIEESIDPEGREGFFETEYQPTDAIDDDAREELREDWRLYQEAKKGGRGGFKYIPAQPGERKWQDFIRSYSK